MKRNLYAGTAGIFGGAGGSRAPWPAPYKSGDVNTGVSSGNLTYAPGSVMAALGAVIPAMTALDAPSPYTVTGVDYNSTTGVLLTNWTTRSVYQAVGAAAASLGVACDIFAEGLAGKHTNAMASVGGNASALNMSREIIIGNGIGKIYNAIGLSVPSSGADPRGWKVYGGSSDTGPWTQLGVFGPFDNAAVGTATSVFKFANQNSYTFYRIEFTHGVPLASGASGKINVGSLALYEQPADYTVRAATVTTPDTPDFVSISLIATTFGVPTVRASRNGGTTLTAPADMVESKSFTDGSKLYVLDVDVSGQVAGTNLTADFALQGQAEIKGFQVRGVS